MKIIGERAYKKELAPQKWHDNLSEIQAFFQSKTHQDITTESGFETIMNTESLMDTYNDMVSALVGSDDESRDLVKRLIRHSAEDARNPFAVPSRSFEGADAVANNANYSSLAKLNSWVIIGYTARSKCMELFHTFSSDDPTVSFKYNIDYITKGSENKKYIRPNADRDGDLASLYELPLLEPVGSAGSPHIKKASNFGTLEGGKTDADYNTNGSKTASWIAVDGGVRGNLFNEQAADGFPRAKYTLEKNPMITGIVYSKDGDDSKVFYMPVFFERKTSTGEQQLKRFHNDIVLANTDGSTESVSIMGSMDLDNSDYMFSVINGKNIKIHGIQLDVRLTNVANELGTIRAGTIHVVEDFSVDNHPYGTVPAVPELSDDFNVGGKGVSAMAYYTDKVVSGLASMRDHVMEQTLDRAYDKPVEQHTLYAKIGGWKGQVAFPLAARLAGGSDPYSWMATGLKNTIISHLAKADMTTYFEDEVARQWYILGAEIDVNRIPDITYSKYDGNAGVGGQNEKYGFTLDGSAGFMDSLGRKVRVIGSSYRRHYQDKNGKRIPMRAVLKSMSLEQPTTLYLPYSFRVYSGIMNEYAHRTGLIVSARDCIKVMSGVQSRIQLVGNDDALYSAICKMDPAFNPTLTSVSGTLPTATTSTPPMSGPAYPPMDTNQVAPLVSPNIWSKNPPNGSTN